MSKYTTAFIDKTVITDRTDLKVRYSETNVRNSILECQQFDLYDILGKNLYERFDGDINDDSYGTPTYQVDFPKYYELMEDYITPYITWGSYIRILKLNDGSPTGNGLGKRESGLTASSANQYARKVEQAEDKARYFEKKLIQFLDRNYSSFDELSEATDLLSDHPKLNQSQIGSLAFFPRKRY